MAAMQLFGGTRTHYELDRDLTATLGDRKARWGIAATVATAWLVIAELIGHATKSNLQADSVVGQLVGAAFELSIAVVVVAAVLAARIPVGWRRGVGLGRWQASDGKTVLIWAGGQYAARFVLASAVVAIAPGLTHGFVSNNDLARLSTAPRVLAVFTAAVIAPVAEELLCRGLILRAVMRRYGFAAGATASSLVFGFAHAYQEPTAEATLLIAIITGTFGMIQCVLVRREGRLLPAVGVHSLVNTVASLLALRH
jgi:membrane protease YdiL (CAAX protease family)